MLLSLTKDNKSPVIQDLRSSIFKYVNDSEKVISTLEMDNMQLSIEVSDIIPFLKHQEKEINAKLELARKCLTKRK
jgi:hypothetical protein